MLKERAKVQEEKMTNNPFQIRLENLKPESRLKVQAQTVLMLQEENPSLTWLEENLKPEYRPRASPVEDAVWKALEAAALIS
eukprot:2028965-Amphidinium_carterae.1